MQGPFTQSYQPLGNLHLKFPDPGELSDYRRQLDIGSALTRVTYRASEVTYTREAFSSARWRRHGRFPSGLIGP